MKDKFSEDIRTDDNVAATDAAGDEPVREVRHTISAKETFTLAKDVFDLRCLIKNIYSNRAQIARRLNIIGTVLSVIFTLLYVAFMLFSGVRKIASFVSQIVAYATIGVFGLLVIVLIILTAVSGKCSARGIKKINKALKILRYVMRLISLAMSICALIMSFNGDAVDTFGVALDTVAVIISIISIIFSLLPLVFGGVGGLARWLISPPKLKHKFSFVILEWYQMLVSDNGASKATSKVSKEYLDDIGRCADGYLLPLFGKKKIQSITVSNIDAAIQGAPEKDRTLCEGVLKNVFAYATECRYVYVNPCKDMNLEGSIEVQEKPKKPTIKDRIKKSVSDKLINTFLSGGEDED